MKKIANMYLALRSQPHMVNWKWRMIVFLLTSIALIFVFEFLQSKYYVVEYVSAQPLSEKLYNWTLVGFLIGMFSAMLLMEGELILAIRRAVRHMERDALGMAKGAENAARSAIGSSSKQSKKRKAKR